jgi:hypothetical protein
VTITVQQALQGPESKWITVSEAARKALRSETQIRSAIAGGDIVGARVFGRVAVLEASLAALSR